MMMNKEALTEQKQSPSLPQMVQPVWALVPPVFAVCVNQRANLTICQRPILTSRTSISGTF